MNAHTNTPTLPGRSPVYLVLPVLTWVVLTLPWLNPFSPGPTPAVMPFLFSWLCITLAGVALVWAQAHGQSQAMVRTVAWAWVTAASVSALIGVLQYFGATAWAGQWLNHTEPGQAFGNLRQRNQFATLLAIGLAALLWQVAQVESDSAQRPTAAPPLLARFMLLAAATLLAAGNAASSSRTGLFQLGLIVLMSGLWQWQQRRAVPSRPGQTLVHQVLLCALVGYVVASIALPLLAGLDPFGSGAWARLRHGDQACTSRLTLWGNVLHLIHLKPWLGWGWGELDYAHFITLYPGERFCDILDNAHNLPLHLAVELGIPIAVLACAVLIALVWRAKPWAERDANRQLAWAVLAVITLHSLLEYPLWYGPFQMAVLLALWLLHPPRPPENPKIYRLFKPVAHYFPGLLAIFLIASITYAAWNYQLAGQIYISPAERLPAYRDNTLEKIRHVALFQDQVRFAELTTTELTAANAVKVHLLAEEMLHFSPEAQVVEILLNSSRLIGEPEEMDFFALRYQAAFPQAYARWAAKNKAK